MPATPTLIPREPNLPDFGHSAAADPEQPGHRRRKRGTGITGRIVAFCAVEHMPRHQRQIGQANLGRHRRDRPRPPGDFVHIALGVIFGQAAQAVRDILERATHHIFGALRAKRDLQPGQRVRINPHLITRDKLRDLGRDWALVAKRCGLFFHKPDIRRPWFPIG